MPIADTKQASSRGVEVAELRSEHAQTRQLADGTFATRLSNVPLNYRDAAGAWQPIDNELVQNPDGSWSNRANRTKVQIPARADGPVTFSDGTHRVSFSLVSGRSAVAARADGAEATFKDAVEDVDVRYEAVGTTLKETLVLRGGSVPSSYRFDVDAGKLSPVLAPSGAVRFEDEAGRSTIGFAVPWMKDANGVVSRGARYEIDGGQIVLRLDERWLASAERRFPVLVDPTVYFGPDLLCEIRSGSRSSTSYCDDVIPDLWVGRDANGIVHRGLFDLEDLELPDYVQVLESWYGVHLVGQTPVEAANLDVHHLLTDFEPGATWSTSDGSASWRTAGGDLAPEREARRSTDDATPYDWVRFDITELMQRLVAGTETEDNLLIKATDETRTHVDVFDDAEVEVRWAPRTGLASRYRYHHLDLPDGSTLDVNVGNGNIVLLSNDIDLESDDGRFTVGRYWNSRNRGESVGTFGKGTRGDFGSISIERNAQDGSYVLFGPGADDGTFHRRNDGSFAAPEGYDAELTENLDGTVTIALNDTTETWTFDTSGRLVQTRQDYGYTIDGTYGADGLTRLTDSLGNSATFAYDRYGDMRTITDDQSAVHRYDYDGSGRLTTYTSPTSAQTRYAWDGYGRLEKITFPDRTALEIEYWNDTGYATDLTPVDALGVDQDETEFQNMYGHTEVNTPTVPRTVYFFDPSTLVVDLIQNGESAGISATGEIPSLDGHYTRGDAPLSVDVSAAQHEDGIQYVELEVDGVEVDSIGDPCDEDTCPMRARETLVYDPSLDAEGSYEYAVNTIDGDDERTDTATWRIGIDRTPPSSSGGSFRDLLDSEVGELSVEWSGATDPPLADATPGRIDYYRYRYDINRQGWSDWATTVASEIVLPGVVVADVVAVEVQAVDGAGNVGATSSTSITATEPPPPAKKTFVIADENASEVYRWTPPALPSGQSLRVVDGGERVIAVNGSDQEMSTVATRFAVDSDDAELAVTYDVSGSDVLIEVAHQQPSTAYPVVVDTNVDDWDRLEGQRLIRALHAPEDAFTTMSGDDDYYVATQAELEFCNPTIPGRARLCAQFYMDSRKATRLTKHLFGTDGGGGRANAFRHAYWVALMIGTAEDRGSHLVGRAIEFSTAHESVDQRSRDSDIKLGSDMDLHNNSEGYEEFFLDYNASDEQMCVRIKHMVPRAVYGRDPGRWRRVNQLVHTERRFSRLVSGRTCAPA